MRPRRANSQGGLPSIPCLWAENASPLITNCTARTSGVLLQNSGSHLKHIWVEGDEGGGGGGVLVGVAEQSLSNFSWLNLTCLDSSTLTEGFLRERVRAWAGSGSDPSSAPPGEAKQTGLRDQSSRRADCVNVSFLFVSSYFFSLCWTLLRRAPRRCSLALFQVHAL